MTRIQLSESQPVETIRAKVLEGPDAGIAASTEAELLSIGTAENNDLRLTDDAVSRFHAELVRTDEGIRLVDHGSTNGTWVASTRVERAIVAPRTVLRLGRSRLQVDGGAETTVSLHAADDLDGLRGRTPLMRRLMARIERVAQSDAAVLLVGESGTGKELMARSIHRRSPRRDGPFVTVDCAALTPGLVGSTLFGHERGAFTGADRRRIGAFEEARGGTLFLDEIGELPAELQGQLLGVLERRTLRRLGGQDDIAVDVRVISATNRDLRRDVNAGGFRDDLYYRLAVVTVGVPPLRERTDDIPLLIEHFLRERGLAGSIDQILGADAMDALMRYDWPGNVRELRNHVEARLALGESLGPPAPSATPSEPAASGTPPHLELPYKQARAKVLEAFETSYLEALLDQADGNVSKAARRAEMDRSHLFNLLRRHGLK